MINNIGIMINADVNLNNWLIKVYMMMDLFGILVYMNVNVINHVCWRIFRLYNLKT